MTEKQLLDYICAEKKIRSILAEIEAINNALDSPSAPPMSPTPPSHNGTDVKEERMDRLDMLREQLRKAKERRYVARVRIDHLDAAVNSELEKDVIDCLYRKGLNVRQTSKYLHFSKAHIYRTRKAVLLIAAEI